MELGELKHTQMKMHARLSSENAKRDENHLADLTHHLADLTKYLHAAIASRKTDTEAGLLQVLGHSVRVRTQEVQGYHRKS